MPNLATLAASLVGGRSVWLLATDPRPTPYLIGMLAGFLVGGFGHVIKSTLMIVTGILLIAVTTALFISATNPSLGGGQ